MDDEDPESSFSCNGCGFCCQLDVALYPEDIVRITRLGHTAFYKKRSGEYFLKRKRGYCTFFDSEKRNCSVYESRPDVCRRFPFKYPEMSSKCTQRVDFSSKVQQHILRFMHEAEK